MPVWAHALDSRRAVRAGGPGSRGAERSRSDAAGALDAGCQEPIIGASRAGACRRGCGLGVVAGDGWGWRTGAAWRLPPSLPLSYTRVGIAGLCFARTVPLTPDESRGCGHSRDGDRSCSGERPGTPPACGGPRGHGRSAVISAQTNPASSRATAVTASPGRFPAGGHARRICRAAAAAPSRSGRGFRGRAVRRRRQVVPMAGPCTVGPGRFDQGGAHGRGPGLGDVPAPGPRPAGVLARHQPGIAHERPGAGEPPPVHHLGRPASARSGRRCPGNSAAGPTVAASGSRCADGASSASIAASSVSRVSSVAR